MSDLDDFIKTVATIGFTYIGRDGQNHPRFRHTNGAEFSTALTPSDYRSRRNALSVMERLAGQRVVRQKSGSYRFKPRQAMVARKSPAEQHTGRHVDDMVTEAQHLRERFAALTAECNPATIAEARSVLHRYNDLRLVLESKHRIIGDINGIEEP